MKTIIIIIMAVILLLSGCMTYNGNEAATNESQTYAIEKNRQDNLFDAEKAKVGDVICGMTIKSMDLKKSTKEDELTGTVDFEGEVTITGAYIHYDKSEFLGHEISFKPDEESSERIPKMSHDARYIWFCFKNHDEAEKAFGKPGAQGMATIVVKDYRINYHPSCVYNTAELVRVISKE